jgi:ribosomal protein L24E
MTHFTLERRHRRRLTPARVALSAALGLLLGLGAGFAVAAPADASGPVSVQGLGGASALGAPSLALNAPIVAMAATRDGTGYWLLGQDGGIFSYGTAAFYGSTGALHLNQPVVGMAATPTGKGYWLVAGDGSIFSFGDATFHGSTGGLRLNQPIVGMAATPTGKGYWLVAADGGIFSFGDATFHGSTGGLPIGTTVSGIAATASGHGYWIAGANGRVFSFGDARVMNPVVPASPIAGLQVAPSGTGLWLVANDGAVYTAGDAPYLGGASGGLMQAVGISRAAHGYWIAMVPSGPPLPPNSGTGRRIVYSNAQQRIWLVEADGQVSHSFLVSGRHGLPAVATYHVFAKLAIDPDGSLVLPWALKFAAMPDGAAVDIHGIPLTLGGVPIEPDVLLGTPESHGCVRLSQVNAQFVFNWASVGTTVVVTDIG